MKSNLLIYSLMDCVFSVASKKSLPNPKSKVFFSFYVFIHFIDFALPFKSVVHFELDFVLTFRSMVHFALR